MPDQPEPQKGAPLNCRCSGDTCSHADGPNVLCQNCGCAKPYTVYEITDDMVERALKAHGETWYDACEGLPGRLSVWADRNDSSEIMRAALEAAING